VINYFENGGKITVCKSGRRAAKNKTPNVKVKG
jgi:hypothetical protein